MPGSRRKTVLISEPHAIENPAPFLPYVWAILKSYWERHGDGDDYQLIVDALQTTETGAPADDGMPWYLGLIFAVYPPAREFFATFGSNQS